MENNNLKYGYIIKDYISLKQILKYNYLRSYKCYIEKYNTYINILKLNSNADKNFIKLDISLLEKNDNLFITSKNENIIFKNNNIIENLNKYILDINLTKPDINIYIDEKDYHYYNDTQDNYIITAFYYLVTLYKDNALYEFSIENDLYSEEITYRINNILKCFEIGLKNEIITDLNDWRNCYEFKRLFKWNNWKFNNINIFINMLNDVYGDYYCSHTKKFNIESFFTKLKKYIIDWNI